MLAGLPVGQDALLDCPPGRRGAAAALLQLGGGPGLGPRRAAPGRGASAMGGGAGRAMTGRRARALGVAAMDGELVLERRRKKCGRGAAATAGDAGLGATLMGAGRGATATGRSGQASGVRAQNAVGGGRRTGAAEPRPRPAGAGDWGAVLWRGSRPATPRTRSGLRAKPNPEPRRRLMASVGGFGAPVGSRGGPEGSSRFSFCGAAARERRRPGPSVGEAHAPQSPRTALPAAARRRRRRRWRQHLNARLPSHGLSGCPSRAPGQGTANSPRAKRATTFDP